MRKLGINYTSATGLTPRESLPLIRKAGFDSLFTMYKADPALMDDFADAAARSGLEWESIHAPFRNEISINSLWLPGEAGDWALCALLRCVDTCAAHGVRVMVVHLSSGDEAPCVSNIGRQRLDALVDRAVQRGVTLGFENQRKLANLAFVFELYENVPQVGFCWDIGHETCFAGGREYMPLFGNRLVYTHIHDNLCQKDGDLHMIPFDGAIDFGRRVELLRRFNYQGSLTLELHPGKCGKYNSLSHQEYFARAYAAAARLRAMLDGDQPEGE